MFTVAQVATEGVLAEAERNAYVADGTVLECGGRTTSAGGIPPLPRRLSLAAGDRLVLTRDLTPVDLPASGAAARIGCTLPEAVAALRPGQPVVFDDGAIDAVVESTAAGEATLRITRTKPGGQRLGAEKGINLPETESPLPALGAGRPQVQIVPPRLKLPANGVVFRSNARRHGEQKWSPRNKAVVPR
ncbi:pyruvate kinase [Solirubrobacter ginsenosidimutans]|uniref:Pyruvate kinase n=1 Tax=Solirubrobacter ginsenosidimutans TaxID=490573 RepID=A0A9X3N582_9ACTN|nr:pyruvate kinase [Solirubrobacter ginsenosidimutans]